MANNPFMIQPQQTQQQSPLSTISDLQKLAKLGEKNNEGLNGIGQQPLEQQVESLPQEVKQQQPVSIMDNPLGTISAAAIVRSINTRQGV